MPSGDYERGDDSAEPLLESVETATATPLPRKRYVTSAITVVLLIVVSIYLWAVHGNVTYSNYDSACRQPAIRREWRAMSGKERLEYLRAVKCLSSIPSTVCNGSLHDEFPFIHRRVGDYSHEAAPFLPWHRYFIHIYEKTLKQHCQYHGTLPYWDWTRDSADLAQAPVWDAMEGFGGNGNVKQPITVGHGHCVEDGLFAGLQVQYYDMDWYPHCLSRGFLTGDFLDVFGAHRLNSSAITSILEETDYYQFVLKLEDGPHASIPIIVRGDFYRFTAPNDPIFFLHHTQIDRLWWKWQSQDFKVRSLAYNGPSRHNSTITAQLTDLIEMAGLAAEIPVSSVMTINNGFLCYKYED
ncbi:putative tyrosinase [Xylaria telfairii]|nr:putative tyrosinase [Xylaria telfairii]